MERAPTPNLMILMSIVPKFQYPTTIRAARLRALKRLVYEVVPVVDVQLAGVEQATRLRQRRGDFVGVGRVGASDAAQRVAHLEPQRLS